MPNWCYNTTIIYGDKEQLKEFWNMLKEQVIDAKKGVKENSWDNLWLGNVFYKYYNEEQINKLGIQCRGAFTGEEAITYDEENGNIEMYYETAWSPNIESWNQLLYDFFPKLKEVTQSEECGMGIYVTNDYDRLYFTDKYNLDFGINGRGDTEYFDSDESLIRYINKWFNENLSTIKDVYDWIDRRNEEDDTYIYLNEFEDYQY